MTFYLETEHPVAVSSVDHIYPCGTSRDNSVNSEFNRKLYGLFPDQMISVLDLGCAGGGMVKSILDDGHIAAGLEGSDYSLLHKRAEWATIPKNLFTCDITKHFILHIGDKFPYQFDVVTAWEVLEHIPEDDLVGMISNIRYHLKTGGLFIGSAMEHHWSENGIDYHVNCKPIEWWDSRFTSSGFVRCNDLESYFGNDWVRSVEMNFVFKKGMTS